MKPDDHQLQALLRQVEIPSGLKSQLLEIGSGDGLVPVDASNGHQPLTGQDPKSKSLDRRQSSWKIATLLAVAASLAVMGLYVFWLEKPETTLPNANRDQREPGREGWLPTLEKPTLENVSAGKLLEQMSADSARLDELMLQIRMNQLKAELAEIERIDQAKLRTNGVDESLSNRESASLILTLADQTAFQLGADRAVVKQGLDFVLENFPGTEGAKLAEQILQTEL